jgi:hypothetical protein
VKRVSSPVKPPSKIGDFAVICYSRIDDRHRPTGKTRHYVGGEIQPAVSGVAICRYPGDADFYLLYCDPQWKPVTDTCHSTVEQAKHQAEFEYAGVSKTWVAVATTKNV